jgi:hypothetical protein
VSRGRTTRILVAATAAAALAVPAGAQGTVTIGSNLGREPDIHADCSVGSSACTVFQTELPESSLASGLSPGESPVNGTITGWRIRSTSAGNSAVALRVIKSAGFLVYTGGGTSATVTPPPSAITSYATQLPIAINDSIGLNFSDNARYFVVNTGATQSRFDPALADGEPGRQRTGRVDNREVAINADIEPSSAISGLKTKAKRGGKVEVSAQVPNAGTLVAGDAKAAGGKAVASAKKPRLLKRTQAQVGSPRSVSLEVKPTKAAKAALAAGRRPKAKLKLVFTPLPSFGGSPGVTVVKVKLKR